MTGILSLSQGRELEEGGGGVFYVEETWCGLGSSQHFSCGGSSILFLPFVVVQTALKL
jgi:hypothetical protein